MASQAFLQSVRAKTGKSLEQLNEIAKELGYLVDATKMSETVTWLKEEFEFSHQQAMALVEAFRAREIPNVEEPLSRLFAGERGRWRPVYDAVAQRIDHFGNDIAIHPTKKFVAFQRHRRKFAALAFDATHCDIGLRRVGRDESEPFVACEEWIPGITHRAPILSHRDVNEELVNWLRRAYEETEGVGEQFRDGPRQLFLDDEESEASHSTTSLTTLGRDFFHTP